MREICATSDRLERGMRCSLGRRRNETREAKIFLLRPLRTHCGEDRGQQIKDGRSLSAHFHMPKHATQGDASNYQTTGSHAQGAPFPYGTERPLALRQLYRSTNGQHPGQPEAISNTRPTYTWRRRRHPHPRTAPRAPRSAESPLRDWSSATSGCYRAAVAGRRHP